MTFKEHLKNYLSDEDIEALVNSFENEAKHAALLNPSKMDDETFLSLFPHVQPHPYVPHAFIYDKKEYDLGKTIYHELGCFYLQEPSAMMVAYLLNPLDEEFVLDLCAAPGGKSIQTSFLMHNTGLIISNDLSYSRAQTIVQNIERLGISNLLITSNDFSKIAYKYQEKFDHIIVDAPCSGSGMFRKDEKMLQDWSYGKVLKFQEIQKEIICYAYDMLKPGGTMIYSTCSYSFEEDEQVVNHLINNTSACIVEIPLRKGFYKKGPGIHLFPHLFPGEGHYICLIKKPGNLSPTKWKQTAQKVKYGDYIYQVSHPIDTKGLNILRYGVKIGKEDKNYFRYDYHYAHFVKEFDNVLELNIEQTKRYFLLETLPLSINKGYVLLKYEGINIDIAKSDGIQIKNLLPKGLKRKF